MSFEVKSEDIDKASPGGNGYVLLPPILGLERVYLNDELVLSTSADFSSAGPILHVPKEYLSHPILKISWFSDSPVGLAPGHWTNEPFAGSFDEVHSRRERDLFRQRYLPLGIGFFLIVIAAAILIGRRFFRDRNKLYGIYLEGLISWGLFQFSLSGVFRVLNAKIGVFVHLPLRELAGLAFVRLLLTLGSVSPRTIRGVSIGCLSIIAVSTLWSIFHHPVEAQVAGYALLGIAYNLSAIFFGYRLIRQETREFFLIAVAIAAFVMLLGSSADFVKLVGIAIFDYESPLPFLNRYVDPPLILTSLIYLVSESSRKYVFEFRAEGMEEARERLLHDLRSPVAALKTAVHHLETKLQKDEAIEILSLASKRIGQMCESLKSERNHAGQTELSKLLKEVTRERGIALSRRNIELRLPPETYTVPMSEIELSRIFSNLINNAHDASSSDAPITIEVKSTRPRKVSVQIGDSGKGIPKRELRNIFQKYFSYGKAGGTGIGLYSAKQFIESNGGIISISSSERGTTVSVTLPLSVA